jgi:hypothetical protein
MHSVGIKALENKLSEYVRAAAAAQAGGEDRRGAEGTSAQPGRALVQLDSSVLLAHGFEEDRSPPAYPLVE